MYVRLVFAVAARLEPEILVLNEMLAVGDIISYMGYSNRASTYGGK